MNIKLGIAPIAWSNDDMPELGGDTPIETCLEEASLAGCTGIELGGKFPRNPDIIKFLLEKYNLSLPSGWYGSKLKERSLEEEWLSMQSQIEIFKKLDSSVFIFAEISASIQTYPDTPLSKRPQLDQNEWKNYCKKISEISNRLDDIGLRGPGQSFFGTMTR